MRRLCIALSALATACAPTQKLSVKALPLPDVPEYLNICAAEQLAAIPEDAMTVDERADLAALLADLRISEVAKAECARQWRWFYYDLKAASE